MPRYRRGVSPATYCMLDIEHSMYLYEYRIGVMAWRSNNSDIFSHKIYFIRTPAWESYLNNFSIDIESKLSKTTTNTRKQARRILNRIRRDNKSLTGLENSSTACVVIIKN